MNNEIGKAGEFFVAAELERRGFKVSLLFGNEECYDILAVNPKSKCISIQVKTTFSKRRCWTLNEKKMRDDPTLFWVFVTLNKLENPCYHIVPSIDVIDYVKQNGTNWKTSTKRFNDKDNKYLDKWDILNY